MINQLKKKYHNLSDNSKNVFLNVLGAFSIKGVALLLSLFTMPAYLRYFDEQAVLGIWFTILSVLSWILNFDLGIGNGLRNQLARTITTGEESETRKYISAAYISVGTLGICTVVLFSFVFRLVNWNAFFRIETSVVSDAALNTVVYIVFIGIIAQLFLKLISSVLYALQKSAVNNLISLVTSIAVFVYATFAPIRDNDSNMISMAFVYTLAVLLPLLVVTLYIFTSKLKNARPSLKYFDFFYVKQVLSLGGIFFFVQIAYMVIMSTNEYLITILVGNESVVEYQIYAKLFTLGSTVFALALTPIWSMITKALSQRNFTWVKSLYQKLLMLGMLGCIIELLLIPFLQLFLNFWLGNQTIVANSGYAFAFAIMGGLMIMNSVLSSVANGAGELKTQAVFFGIGAVIKFPLAIILVDQLNSWIGVVVANIVAMGIYCVVQPFWLKKYMLGMERHL